MAKVEQGRLFGVYAMGTYTAAELDSLANDYLQKIADPANSDDPKWLNRRATRLRKLARQEDRSVEHKVSQKD